MPSPGPLQSNPRPPRSQVDPAALALLERHGPQILSTARRYSANLEDAEDAYQRAFEILLTKAPSTREQDLIPWLKTVVKHEAFAIRRQRERHTPVTDDGELEDMPTALESTHEQAERYEQLLQGAEALNRLKPQEIRALLLKAEGYSYKEICEITGWTYTKVNRALTEGRVALAQRLSQIRDGAECARYTPLLSALVDGEAEAADLGALRAHLRTCLTCRARLKEFRSAPGRVAAVAPPLALAAGDGGVTLRGMLESLVGAAQHKAAVLGERAHAAIELAGAQKAAAVTASTFAIAGGVTAGGTEEPAPAKRPERAEVRQVASERPTARVAPRTPQATVQATQPRAGASQTPPPIAPQPPPAPSQPPPQPSQPPRSEQEFAPAQASVTPATPRAPAPATKSGGGAEFGP